MAAESQNATWARWVLWFILGEFVMIAILTPMLGRDALDWLTRVERQWSLAELGLNATLWVETSGFRAYATIFRDTGAERNVYEFFLPTQDLIVESRGLEALGANVYFPMVKAGLDALFGSLQRLFVRLAAVVLWLPTVPLFLVPAVLDGMMSWRRKQYTFDYPSPLVHGYAAAAVKCLLVGLPLALLLPVPIPPLLAPFFFIGVSLLIMVVASHTMKRI
ncbi:hypothetical protein FHW79_006302 [Azospirillum sp. OGB3]|uniref:DUF4400 domain-containing protein n=1 Tax=Azospirillum argentinense TaxID=2970906 RepID=A0A5B0KPH4_9PROT|nr:MULTISPECIES: DUF4400 domain-containing protein [Azospirillum]KAA1053855.1 hypothetical protein FH063_002437 [Azospirillum argentinense]MBB3268627.1 hypothetical protein [Azospirillum sp. OGB3]